MFSWLLSLLGLRAPRPAPVPPGRIPPKPAPAGRIALVIGHNSRAQGAVRVTDGRSEYDWCGVLALLIAAKDPARYVVIRRQPGRGEITRAYREMAAAGVRGSIELHFNAATPAATGIETLTSGSAGSRRCRWFRYRWSRRSACVTGGCWCGTAPSGAAPRSMPAGLRRS